MDEQEPKTIPYEAPSPRPREAVRFERNGWVALAVTLALCAIAAFLWVIT